MRIHASLALLSITAASTSLTLPAQADQPPKPTIEIVQPGPGISYTDTAEIDLVFEGRACNFRQPGPRENYVSWTIYNRDNEAVCVGDDWVGPAGPSGCVPYALDIEDACDLGQGWYMVETMISFNHHSPPDDSDIQIFRVIPGLRVLSNQVR